MPRNPLLPLPLLALAAAACTVETVSHRPAPVAPGYAAASQRVIVPAPGSYCEEAVGVAQDAAARAAYSGSPRDVGRAERTAQYAARDCR